MDSRLYWIWLAQVLGAGEASMGELIARFGDAEGIYFATEQALRGMGASTRVVRRLRDKSLANARTILNRVVEAGDWVLTPDDALYPVNLRRLPDCPAALYCRGTMPDMNNRLTLAFVGTRRTSEDGWRAAYSLASGLAAGGAIIVTGGARGIDAAANVGAVDSGGVSVAVRACPLDEDYPYDNTALRARMVDAGGLLMSEYPHGEEYRCVFQVRNRLIAGLSHGVCLGETPIRSGARNTAKHARELGREVFAMPAALSGHKNDGAHAEIRYGAALITCAADVLEDYEALFADSVDIAAAKEAQKLAEAKPSDIPTTEKPVGKSKREQSVPPITVSPPTAGICPETASPDAKTVYAALTSQPQPVDDLAAATGLSIPVLLGALTELEMFGCAANAAGQRYVKL